MPEPYQYAAFISYSSKDSTFARRLHRALETYRIPKALGSINPLGGKDATNRIYPIFRDREELSAGKLDEAIQAALDASSSLVVICSPAAVASQWVGKEIKYFMGLGRNGRIFAIIADNAPVVIEGADATGCLFPAALVTDPSSGGVELVAADARESKDGFRNAWLKCLAGIAGLPFGKLLDRDLAAQRKRLAQIGVALLAIAFSIGIAGFGFIRLVQQQAQRSSNTLAELSKVAASEKEYDSAARYSLAGVVGYDSPFIGFDPHLAEGQLVQGIAQTFEIPSSHGLFYPDGLKVIASYGIGLALWDLKSGKARALASGHEDRISHASGTVKFMRLSPDRGTLVTGLYEMPDLCSWSVRTKARIHCHIASSPYAVAFRPDGLQIPVVSVDFKDQKSAIVLDLLTGQILANHAAEAIIEAVAISPDAKFAALAQGADLIEVFAVAGGKSVLRIQDLSGSDRETFIFSPDSRMLLVAGRDVSGETETGYMELHDAVSGNSLWKIGHIPDWGHSVRFSPNGNWIAVSSNDKILLLDANTGSTLQTLKSDFGGASSLAFSPDSLWIAFSVADFSLRLWDLASLKEIARFRGHQSKPAELSFDKDGKQLLSASEKGSLRIWDIDKALHLRGADLIAAACSGTMAKGKSRFSDKELARAPMLHPTLNADPCQPPSVFKTLATALGL